MKNQKLTSLLKKLFENKEFEISLIDNEDVYDGYNYVTEEVIYNFKFHVVVESVLGVGTRAVGSIDIIIDDIVLDGESVYLGWAEINYSEHVWYINELNSEFYDDYLKYLPFSVYTNVYGYDEKQ
jgi:hypothetical protein